jgi:hypothetical protein
MPTYPTTATRHGWPPKTGLPTLWCWITAFGLILLSLALGVTVLWVARRVQSHRSLPLAPTASALSRASSSTPAVASSTSAHDLQMMQVLYQQQDAMNRIIRELEISLGMSLDQVRTRPSPRIAHAILLSEPFAEALASLINAQVRLDHIQPSSSQLTSIRTPGGPGWSFISDRTRPSASAQWSGVRQKMVDSQVSNLTLIQHLLDCQDSQRGSTPEKGL